MRTAILLLTTLALTAPAIHADTLTFEEAATALKSPEVERRRAGLSALNDLVLEHYRLGWIEDEQEGRPAIDRDKAVTLLQGALADPALAVGMDWLTSRVLLARNAEGGFSQAIGARGPVIIRPELDRWLPEVAKVVAHKQDDVVGASLVLLLTYDFESPAIAPAAARCWTHLTRYERVFLLTERWERVRNPALAATLGHELREPERAVTWHHTDDVPSLIAWRALEFAPERARTLILADMRRATPRFTRNALLALPDETLPDMEPIWTKHLADRAHRDLDKLAPLIERYATAAMKPAVLEIYHSARTGWACDIQAALVRYLLKHDAKLGLAEVKKAMQRRGKRDTRCYRTTLFETLTMRWSTEAEALALEHLEDDDLEVVRSAAHALLQAGPKAVFEAVLARMARLDREKTPDKDIRSWLLLRLDHDYTRWREDPALVKKVRDALEPDERRYLDLESR